MVTLPKEFVATKYPGYFWNIKDKQLYSVKITGMLKPLASTYLWRKNYPPNPAVPGYNISVKGRKRFMSIEELTKLSPTKSVFPIYSEQLSLL